MDRRALVAVKIYAPAVFVTFAGFFVAYQFVDPAPPSRLTIATGGPSGAYALFAEAYARVLAREGVTLEQRRSAGSVENLGLLVSAEVDVAFVQGGTSADQTGLRSLGSLYYEPLWVFHRLPSRPERLSALRGRRIAVGPEGSGTRAIAVQLLNANGVTQATAALSMLGGSEVADALIEGKLDAAFLVASARSPAVERLLSAPGIELMSFARSEAYVRLYRYLSSVRLPRGVIDLERDVPAEDVVLLAPTANLVASERLHPALADLLLQAAAEVHGKGGLFERNGEFPSAAFTEFQVSAAAKRFYESGPPFLQRFLPFWAATLVDRMLVMLLPLVALLIPLLRIMPPLYRWRIRARIYRWYRELVAIDPALRAEPTSDAAHRALSELTRIEDEAAKVTVPMSYADQLYHLRAHIELVRGKLLAAAASTPSDPP